MKKILLFAALIIGSLMAQAQSASTLRDVTAALGDSICIMPKFAKGDTRTYHVTAKTQVGEYKNDSTSMDYHLTVESVDPDYYALYLTINNYNYDGNLSGFPDASQLVNFFAKEGIRFHYNRQSLKVDSLDSSRLVNPLIGFLTNMDNELNHIFNMDSVQQFVEREFHNGIDDIAAEMLEEIIKPWVDQYGRTYALGDSHWTESESFDDEEDDPMAMDADTVEVVMDSDDIWQGKNDNAVVVDCEELPDFSMQMVHQAFADRGDDGSINYREKITWNNPFVDNWCEEREASFDAKGWPIEISHTITMGESSISTHWQLIE